MPAFRECGSTTSDGRGWSLRGVANVLSFVISRLLEVHVQALRWRIWATAATAAPFRRARAEDPVANDGVVRTDSIATFAPASTRRSAGSVTSGRTTCEAQFQAGVVKVTLPTVDRVWSAVSSATI